MRPHTARLLKRQLEVAATGTASCRRSYRERVAHATCRAKIAIPEILRRFGGHPPEAARHGVPQDFSEADVENSSADFELEPKASDRYNVIKTDSE